ncbi:mitochondrial RNA pseudouridine synthase Rpusd4 [Caerostris darwini]|uniref:Pseudouridylate synthase RPUSD4, mitochondrial n=1 Tax=Caerostris darwini TaxID=1538125 RepID=A0AAV4VK73_9ARAC|nr:mitochondrial RNA pseudouridine synthase Rpusd4 [Caerostris darwini]
MFMLSKGILRFPINYIVKSVKLPIREFNTTYCLQLRKASSKRKSVDIRNEDETKEFYPEHPQPKMNKDFFGIEGEGVIKIENKPSSLTNQLKSETNPLLNDKIEEKVVNAGFGTVRYDSQNRPKFHGQFENATIKSSSVVNSSKNSSQDLSSSNHNNYIDELYFSNSLIEKQDNIKSDLNNSSVVDSSKNSSQDLSDTNSNSYVDELYFSNSLIEKQANITSELNNHPFTLNDEKSNFVDNAYFNNDCTRSDLKNFANESVESIKIDLLNTKLKNQNSPLITNNEKISFIDENIFGNEFENKIYETDFETTSSNQNFHSKSVNNSLLINEGMINNQSINETIQRKDLKNSTLNSHLPEKFSIESNNLKLEQSETYGKISDSVTKQLFQKKNKFYFQSEDFFKEVEVNSNKISSKKKTKMYQKKVNDIEKIEDNSKMNVNIEPIQNLKTSKIIDQENTSNNEQPETAYEFVKKLRITKTQLDPVLINGKFVPKSKLYDSKGFRILKNQVPNLLDYTKDEILELLEKNVLYSDEDLIVLNKPYNLVMHESKTVKDACLSEYLNDLAAVLDKHTHKPKLFTVHRLDKETSGCLLLARNEASAQKLKSLFSERKITKTYWIVTIKVPQFSEGVIDIPISEGFINNRARMVLHPNLPKDIPYENHSKHGKRAVTHYKVIAESGNAALVEVKPETGIKHQIRVHFGFGLSCPILGDHKYSHLDKLVPQKLPADLLQKLLVRQSKVRHIPLHIYARSILIPRYRDERNLFVMAPMPVHMSTNLQKLKFKK